MIAVLAAAVSLVAAVSAFGGSGTSTATTVTVTAGKPSEFHFILSKKTIVKGVTTFKVTNKGTIDHNFKIAGKKTRVDQGRQGDDAQGHLREGREVPVPVHGAGHAAGGMKGTLTVKTT